MRNRPHVPAILKLPEILREMLLADVNMRPVDAALEHGPEALNPVQGLPVRADIFLPLVPHKRVLIAVLPKVLLAANSSDWG